MNWTYEKWDQENQKVMERGVQVGDVINAYNPTAKVQVRECQHTGRRYVSIMINGTVREADGTWQQPRYFLTACGHYGLKGYLKDQGFKGEIKAVRIIQKNAKSCVVEVTEYHANT